MPHNLEPIPTVKHNMNPLRGTFGRPAKTPEGSQFHTRLGNLDDGFPSPKRARNGPSGQTSALQTNFARSLPTLPSQQRELPRKRYVDKDYVPSCAFHSPIKAKQGRLRQKDPEPRGWNIGTSVEPGYWSRRTEKQLTKSDSTESVNVNPFNASWGHLAQRRLVSSPSAEKASPVSQPPVCSHPRVGPTTAHQRPPSKVLKFSLNLRRKADSSAVIRKSKRNTCSTAVHQIRSMHFPCDRSSVARRTIR